MTHLRRFIRRLVTFFRAGKAESDLAREINAHLQLLEDQFVGQGMSREDARYAARRTFGGVEQTKELQRDARSFRWLAGWPMDLKLGVRMLAKSPGLTIIAVVALAVAMGAGAMYLELLQDVLYPRHAVYGDRLVGIRVWDVERGRTQTRVLHDFAVWRGEATTLDQLGVVRSFNRHFITEDGRTEPARGAEISACAFRLFAVRPLIGRALTDDDERPEAAPVVVIGDELWQRRFGRDPNVLGRIVRLGRVAHTLVGVMPGDFGFPLNQNLWTPLKVPASGIRRGEGPDVKIFGLLRPGVSADAASSELSARLREGSGGQSASPPAPARRVIVRPYVTSLMLLGSNERMATAAAYAVNLIFITLLAICGANVATLVFARTATREAEITVRTALGASRGRICGQLFAEALVLSSVAAVAGLAAARFGGLWVKRIFMDTVADGQSVPFWWDDRLAAQTIVYVAALAVLAALIVGVIPALKATTANMQGRLREGGGGSTMKFGRLWTGVIVTQAAITVMFLATAVSVGWATYLRYSGSDVRYPREKFLMARLMLEESDRTRPADAEMLHAVAARLRTEPGVVGVTYTTSMPGTTLEPFVIEFAPTSEGKALQAEAGARADTDEVRSAGARVGVNFFDTVGIPLVSGRFFSDAEILGGHTVAIVDETFVRLILGGRNPLGLMVREPRTGETDAPGPWHEIVGVVKDVTTMPRKESEDSVLYRPAAIGAASPVRLLIRTQSPTSPMPHTLQAAALSVNPDARLSGMASLDAIADREGTSMRFFLRVFLVVSAVALLLSTAGVYALVSFTLARRTRDIGIRVALGAEPRRIISGTFSRVFTQFAIGVLVGAIPAFVILGNGAEDGGHMGIAAGLAAALAVGTFVIAVAMVACAVPLRRALRIEPMDALRTDG
jgi:putative ABC transport system permease protein